MEELKSAGVDGQSVDPLRESWEQGGRRGSLEFNSFCCSTLWHLINDTEGTGAEAESPPITSLRKNVLSRRASELTVTAREK